MKSHLKVLVSRLAVGAMTVTLFAAVPASVKHDQGAQATRSLTNADQRDPANASFAERDPANARFAQGAGMYGDPDKHDPHNHGLT